MKIYTKGGDNGTSTIFSGSRYSKSELVFEVLGTLDELNACLGFLHNSKLKRVSKIVYQIQMDLFSIGAYVAGKDFGKVEKTVWKEKIHDMEELIDEIDAAIEPLRHFILPGGCVEANQLHLSRAVCRELERRLVAYINHDDEKKFVFLQRYINRLSDLLFVLARFANHQKKIKEIVWRGNSLLNRVKKGKSSG